MQRHQKTGIMTSSSLWKCHFTYFKDYLLAFFLPSQLFNLHWLTEMPRQHRVPTAPGRQQRSPHVLAPWKLRMIDDMLVSGKTQTVQDIAEVAECTQDSVIQIRNFLHILAFRGWKASATMYISQHIYLTCTALCPRIALRLRDTRRSERLCDERYRAYRH